MAGKRSWRWLGWLIGVLIILGALALLVIYAGVYNVAATWPDIAPVRWVLDTTMDHSVKHHAARIAVPPLDDPAMVRRGSGHYRRMCAFCHGAPGMPIGDLGQGLNPAPPALTESVPDWKPNELFWIAKNGVRMTGMPAWGVTHTDEQLWDIVAFLQRLPTLTPAEYQTLLQQAPATMK